MTSRTGCTASPISLPPNRLELSHITALEPSGAADPSHAEAMASGLNGWFAFKVDNNAY
jgi:hypothetical protein